MRSRNIDFSASSLKPLTNSYAFFDGEDVNKFIVPKLLQISMTTGTFQVGETVIGTSIYGEGKELIRFRVAQANHKLGDYDNPGVIYTDNPYFNATPLTITGELTGDNTRIVDEIVQERATGAIAVGPDGFIAPGPRSHTGEQLVMGPILYPAAPPQPNPTIPAEYSTTTTLINIDTLSLSDKSENTYYGYVEDNLQLIGQTSGAQATVRPGATALKTDNIGYLRGSFFIPDPNDITTPKFECGKKVLRLTSSGNNSQVPGAVSTDASSTFDATGQVETLQSTIISVRNINTHTQRQIETQTTDD